MLKEIKQIIAHREGTNLQKRYEMVTAYNSSAESSCCRALFFSHEIGFMTLTNLLTGINREESSPNDLRCIRTLIGFISKFV